MTLHFPRTRAASRNRALSRSGWLAGLILTLSPVPHLSPGTVLAAEESTLPAEIDVAVDQGLLSVAARDAPLSDVVGAIGQEPRTFIVPRGANFLSSFGKAATVPGVSSL